jgi:hypothetical protein
VSPQVKRPPFEICDVLYSLPLSACVELIQRLRACLDPSFWGGSLSGCLESVFLFVPEYGSLAEWDKWRETPATAPLECLLCPLRETGTWTFLWPKRTEYMHLPSVMHMRPWKAFRFGNCFVYRTDSLWNRTNDKPGCGLLCHSWPMSEAPEGKFYTCNVGQLTDKSSGFPSFVLPALTESDLSACLCGGLRVLMVWNLHVDWNSRLTHKGPTPVWLR